MYKNSSINKNKNKNNNNNSYYYYYYYYYYCYYYYYYFCYYYYRGGFDVSMKATINTVLWVVTPGRLVEIQ